MAAINFQPTEAKSPSALPEPGYYYGKIVEASIRPSKSGGTYLNVAYDLLDSTKTKVGRIYDIISESEKPFSIYKLQRFGQALGLVGKSLELKDLEKIIINKVIIFRVKIEKSEGYADKAVVDIGDEGIYYNKSEALNFFEPAPSKIPFTTVTKEVELNVIQSDTSALSVVDDDDEF